MEPKPLDAPPTARRGPNAGHDWDGIAAKLRKHPNTWFEVARFEVTTNQVWRIKTGANPAFRDGAWDAVTRTEDGTRVLYVCYLGESE
jgi:hypothetical protein